MSKEKEAVKKDVGIRFSRFRKEIKKTQQQLADELQIYQSTITNFEKGKTFPSLYYLFYFHEKYGLNITWLITGAGNMFVKDYYFEDTAGSVREKALRYHCGDNKNRTELLSLMDIPVVEQIVMAKFLELKTLLKDEIGEYYRMKDRQEKKEKSNEDENR